MFTICGGLYNVYILQSNHWTERSDFMATVPLNNIDNRSATEKVLMSTGNIFSYSNHKCECLCDTRHNDEGLKFYEFIIRPNNNIIDFAYNAEGLVSKNKKALIDLLSLEDNNVAEMQKYIENYGFLFHVPLGTYTTFKYDDISSVMRRIKYTTNILSMLCKDKCDYSELLFMVSYLIFNSTNIETFYNSPSNPIKEFVTNPLSIPEIPYDPNDPDIIIEDIIEELSCVMPDKEETLIEKNVKIYSYAFVVPDIFMESKEYCLYYEDYTESKQHIESSPYYNAMVYLFRNYEDTDSIWRKFIEFFFHIQHDVAPITKFDTSKMELFDDMSAKIAPFFENQIFQEGLKDIAQLTVKFELDEMLKGITPKYDIQNKAPSWESDNLVSALYFSIFYRDFSVSVIKRCRRKECRNYFEVSTTNSRKKYCSIDCQNADAQKRHRKKSKQTI